MGETAPNELAIPGAAVSPAWKAKAELVEALNHAVGAILLLKQLEYCPNSALHFLVWIENNLVGVVHKPNWYREAQLTLLRLVEFCSVEARANNVEFCLCELPFYAKDKTVVEVGWIVTPSPSNTKVLVIAHSSNNLCQSLLDRARREASREKMAPT